MNTTDHTLIQYAISLVFLMFCIVSFFLVKNRFERPQKYPQALLKIHYKKILPSLAASLFLNVLIISAIFYQNPGYYMFIYLFSSFLMLYANKKYNSERISTVLNDQELVHFQILQTKKVLLKDFYKINFNGLTNRLDLFYSNHKKISIQLQHYDSKEITEWIGFIQKSSFKDIEIPENLKIKLNTPTVSS